MAVKHQIKIGGKVSQVTPPATQADHVPQFGQIPAFEHQITGSTDTLNVSGTFALGWTTKSVYTLTMTAATEFLSSNKPVSGESKIIEIFLTGAFAPTFTGWILMTGADPYDGAKINRIQVDCIDGTIYYDNRTTT